MAQRLKGHVEVLAGLIGPRHLGKPSSMEAAAAYIERQLAASGDAVGRQTHTAFGQQLVLGIRLSSPDGHGHDFSAGSALSFVER